MKDNQGQGLLSLWNLHGLIPLHSHKGWNGVGTGSEETQPVASSLVFQVGSLF